MTSTLRKIFRHAPPSRPATTETPVSAWFESRREHVAPLGLPRDFLSAPNVREQVDAAHRPLLDDPGVLALIQRDEVPIPAGQDREGYFDGRDLSYWLSGLVDYRMVRERVPASALANVLDLGGATGRFARHVALGDEASRVTVAELSFDHVLWCDRHFTPRMRAVKISHHGHLPFADGSMTLCTALSVFTHIDEFESTWLAEIDRVLAVDGYAFVTIHCEHTWAVLDRQPWLLEVLRKDPTFPAEYHAEAAMPAERLVYNYMPGTKYHCCNTFVHTDYVRRSWSKWLDIVAIEPNAHHRFQTVVVMRKKR